MMTLIAAAVLAAQTPAAPTQVTPVASDQHAQHQQGKQSDKGMDCCKECCKDMAKMHEGHGTQGASDHQQHAAQ